MKAVVVAKIVQETLRASSNFSTAHWLHHPMNVKNQVLILKYSHLPLTSLRWTILEQLALYTDEGQLIARRCR